jgi:hypothetical protein
MANDIIDINVYETTETVAITVNPNLTTVNINEVVGVIPQNLQEVTNVGSTTTNSITANSFIKSGGTGTNILLDNGNVVALSSVVGNTNLTTSQTSTNFTINSDTGTDAVVPLGNGTNAGASLNNYTTAEQTKLSGIATGAEVNVNADWNSVSGDSQILNKPTIPSISGLATVTYVDTQDALKVDKVAGSRLITSAESTILGNTSGTNTGDQNLQSVTTLGATTTNSITANSFVKSGGTSSQILAADGSVITQGNNITITGGVISSVGGTGGGGASVNYYLNGGTSQDTFGGATYYEFSKTAVVGTNVDFNISTNGYIASFITDVADPSLLLIPAGNWNLEFFFSSSSAGGSPSFYAELYKYDGATFTSIASSSAVPEGITNGTAIDAYFTALAVPETVLTVNDRLAIRVFVNASSKTITLHTQNGHLCEVITTFSTGLTALNGLQTQVQNLAVETTGTDFAINSSGSTHTFNLPTASASNRGALSSANWSTFNGKQDALGFTPYNATNPSGYQTAGQVQTIADAKVVQTITNGVTTTAPSQDAVFDALALKQPLATVLTNTTASFTTADETKLDKYPSTATNGKILQGNGTNYVEIDTPTGTTNLNYTPAVSNGTVTSSTGSSATIPLANGTNAGLLTAAEKTKIAGAAPLASPTFTGTPTTATTPAVSDNSFKLATTEYVDRQVGLGDPNNINITTVTNITTESPGIAGGTSYPQYGKNVMVSNGANAITITVTTATTTDFIASYTKLGTANITFVTGLGATLKGFPAGAEVTVINGIAGSTALLTRTGNTFYLQVNNLS